MPATVKPKQFSPFWQTDDGEFVKLYQGHVTDVLRRLPAGSVQMVCTSPPY
jgi:DNA modification methylase